MNKIGVGFIDQIKAISLSDSSLKISKSMKMANQWLMRSMAIARWTFLFQVQTWRKRSTLQDAATAHFKLSADYWRT